MNTSRLLSGLLLAAALSAGAQERKPGLYELTLTTTNIAPSPSTAPPRVMQVCLTQEMIDKYGAIVPQTLTRICQLSDVVKKPGGMRAELVCSGALNGKGTLDVEWSDDEHARGKIHFSGSMHPADTDIKIEWNATTNSVYKSPNCGAIQPAPSAVPPPDTPAPSAPTPPNQ